MEKMAKQTGGFRYYTNPAPLTMDEVRFIFSGFPNIYQLHMHVILPMLEKVHPTPCHDGVCLRAGRAVVVYNVIFIC